MSYRGHRLPHVGPIVCDITLLLQGRTHSSCLNGVRVGVVLAVLVDERLGLRSDMLSESDDVVADVAAVVDDTVLEELHDACAEVESDSDLDADRSETAGRAAVLLTDSSNLSPAARFVARLRFLP